MNESFWITNNLCRKQHLQYVFWLLLGGYCCQACYPALQKGTIKDDECPAQFLAFEYLKIGAVVDYQDQKNTPSRVHIRLRIKKDQLIWFSVSAPWGLEVLRGIITPVSITLLNHAQKAYYVYDYVTLRTIRPGPWDYTLLQALLLGELPCTTASYKTIQKNAQTIVMQQKKIGWTLTYFLNPTLKRVEKSIVTANKGSLVTTYNLFKPDQGSLLFKRATLAWYDRATPMRPNITVTLKGLRSKQSQKPLPFPFSIPAHYEKKQTMPNG